jgi:hypothetical protein
MLVARVEGPDIPVTAVSDPPVGANHFRGSLRPAFGA